ncbi:hypothetical protein SCOCK_70144 [Actinacidiphila cocklensis]|uniref:Uncharacterized protein n=1 Tax=Actinacidiphila cocklensis TaxID=887465 RepID=A0A9W4DVJ5_9ACTN|nr:hypothetical protein SCOCK_70144 [Actinacidiphila cocklensis]
MVSGHATAIPALPFPPRMGVRTQKAGPAIDRQMVLHFLRGPGAVLHQGPSSACSTER